MCGPCSISSRDCVYASAPPDCERNGEPRPASTSRSPLRLRREPAPSTEAPVHQPFSLPGVASLVDGTSFRPGQPSPSSTPSNVRLPTIVQPGVSPEGRLPPAVQRFDDGHHFHYVYSPDTVSSELLTADLASTRWFDLLVADAAQADAGFTLAPSRPHTRPPSPSTELRTATAYDASQPGFSGAVPSVQAGHGLNNSVARIVAHDYPDTSSERREWQLEEDISLRDEEVALFRTFTERAALWLDLFDPCRHFSTHATRLAVSEFCISICGSVVLMDQGISIAMVSDLGSSQLRNLGLMKAILALTSRHAIARSQPEANDVSVPVQYYYETLHYVQVALQYTSYTHSQELLATVIIISTYEMLDESNSNWKRHLKGVFWIQRSQDVDGASGGLRQAVWWAWLRQDLWAAFREKRTCFSFWKPVKDLPELSQDELADRAVYLLSQCVNYCANNESSSVAVADRIRKGDSLMAALERWRTFLGPSYKPLPSPAASGAMFKPIWIHPPRYAVALQVFNFAKILLTLHRPAVAGLQGYMQTQRVLLDAVETICGIARELKDEGCQILSAQCLFGAGLCTQEPVKREHIVSLIKTCEKRTGWPMATMTDDLRAEWAKFR